jgi:drug/metabolite transporter (DMT)-like permease
MWILVAVSGYIILAIVQLVDKYLLVGSIPNPKIYAFYVGTLGVSVLVLAPLVGFYFPEINNIILSLLAGAVFIYALFWLYKGLHFFEASRVIPAIGGLVPLFTFGLIYLFSFGQETLTFRGIIAFILMISGSVFIVLRKEKTINLKSLKISLIAAFLLSLSFVLVKYVYLAMPFWTGFIWKSIGGFLMAICFFIFNPEVRKEIFKKREYFPRKTATIFLVNQAAGGGAAILQNWAIALAPLVYVAFINALQGIQYTFLFIFALLLSFKFPQILKEEISKEVIFQKIIAILLIGGGLLLLSL